MLLSICLIFNPFQPGVAYKIVASKKRRVFFRRKRKDELSQKNTWKYDVFFKGSEKMVFPKKAHWNMISFVISKNMVFLFFPKILYFFLKQKMKDDLSQKLHGNMIFSVYMYKCYKYDITLLPKKQR